MLKCLPIVFVYFLTVSTVLGRSTSGHLFQSLADDKDEKKIPSSFWNDALFMYKAYQQCSKEDTMTCLKVKLLAGMDRTFQYKQELEIMKGIKFINGEGATGSTNNTQELKTEKDIEASLPRSFDEKDNALNDMILHRVMSFLQSHTLQIRFPNSKDLERSFDESRKKDKKSGAYIMIPLLLGGTFIPIAYGALAILAGKALIVSKLALVLASIIGIKKLLGGNSKESQHEVVVSSGGHGGSGWGREFDLAYKGYEPALKLKSQTS